MDIYRSSVLPIFCPETFDSSIPPDSNRHSPNLHRPDQKTADRYPISNMCSYTYSWYYCNHDYYICKTHGISGDCHADSPCRANSIEVCSSRLLSGYSYDAWSIDMCSKMKIECGGFSNYYCNDCSEDVALEFELDELYE
ncbi:mitochondrial carrier [Pyrenophora seminiperda CCB06]|uniref:Mitochondrial carrier n=1 Tax=Pyrenophora seminiperda CCB06 TaxID=1302712 RepID=A0A3M7M4T9_9PLEO|nr:mitochondrial carrier [Pyrenophora seminiperda CCB06]